MDISEKLDLLIQKIDEHFKQIDERLDRIEKRLDKVEARLDRVEERLDKVEARLDSLEARFDNLEARFDKFEEQNKIEHKEIHDRITRLEAKNLEQHEKMMNMLNSLNSTIIRLETDFSDKIAALFDSRADFLDHKKTYGHELENIKKIVKNNTFRITSLEHKLEQN